MNAYDKATQKAWASMDRAKVAMASAKSIRNASISASRTAAKLAVWNDTFTAEDPRGTTAAWDWAVARAEEVAWEAFDDAIALFKVLRKE